MYQSLRVFFVDFYYEVGDGVSCLGFVKVKCLCLFICCGLLCFMYLRVSVQDPPSYWVRVFC